jgi:hypothetical protein
MYHTGLLCAWPKKRATMSAIAYSTRVSKSIVRMVPRITDAHMILLCRLSAFAFAASAADTLATTISSVICALASTSSQHSLHRVLRDILGRKTCPHRVTSGESLVVDNRIPTDSLPQSIQMWCLPHNLPVTSSSSTVLPTAVSDFITCIYPSSLKSRILHFDPFWISVTVHGHFVRARNV